MKKLTIFLLIIMFVATMAFAGVGCKEEASTTEEVVEESKAEEATKEEAVVEEEEEEVPEYGLAPGEIAVIRFVTMESSALALEAFDFTVSEFEKLHPNVKIQLELMGVDVAIPYYAANIAAGNAPDIGQTWDSIALSYYNQGLTLPVNDVIEKMGGLDNILVPDRSKKINGDWVFVPWSWGAPVFWYRTDLFEEYNLDPPETFDDWLNVAETLTLDTDNDGTIDIYGTNIAAGKNLFTEIFVETFVWQQGETIVDKDMNVNFDSPAVIESLTKIQQLAEFCPPGIGNYSFYDMIDNYAGGKIATAMYAGRMSKHLEANNPDLLKVTKAIPVPTNDVLATNFGGKNLVIFKDSKYPEIAKDFAAFLTSGEAYIKYLLSNPGLLVPATKSAYDDPMFWNDPFVVENLENIQVCFDGINYAVNALGEPGATAVDGKITPDPELINEPYLVYEGDRPYAQAVQQVIINDMSPEDAAAWGPELIESLLAAAAE